MDYSRAQEIVQSKAKIQVAFNGEAVWIDELDQQANTARVHTERNPADTQVVPIDQLVER